MSMATPMASPCFPGQQHPQQAIPMYPQYMPIAVDESIIIQAQAQAQANAYYAWFNSINYQQAAPSHHPYAMNPQNIQHAFHLAANDNRRGKGARQPFAEWQLNLLRQRFAEDETIKVQERRQLAKIVKLSEVQIKVWFQNRRHKLRREQREKAAAREELLEEMNGVMKKVELNGGEDSDGNN
uniref:Homeobox domain-containing protein n=1 Tax=Caenorhabditis tropicalis TaxID=1561998 RepID=A0A1I7T699_9PELO